MTEQLRERTDKWDYMKLKSFYTKKEMVSKELSHRMGEKSLPAVHLARN
jgi:hypothetical protein